MTVLLTDGMGNCCAECGRRASVVREEAYTDKAGAK